MEAKSRERWESNVSTPRRRIGINHGLPAPAEKNMLDVVEYPDDTGDPPSGLLPPTTITTLN
jgi:hypothetical protein